MGAIEDLRKVVQDLVTPDFRALEARVSSLEAKLDLTGKSLNDKIDSTARGLNEKIDSTAKGLNEKIDSTAKGLNDKIDSTAKDLRERLAVTATKSELVLTREVIMAELQTFRTSVELNITRLTMSLDLDKRLAKVEAERAQEQVRQLEKTA